MIYDNIGIKPLGENDGVITGNITQNNIPVLEENYVSRMNANNGFSKERLFRKFASIPIVAWIKAAQEGYNLDDESDLKRFLSENPDYLTVAKINTNRPANIIVR